MALTIKPVLPVLTAPEAGSIAPGLALPQGGVVNAQVLKVMSAELVRIAIASLSIDVTSEVPLKEGQQLKLAVSQGADGSVRLAMLGQGTDVAGDAVTLSPQARVETAANSVSPTSPKTVLTPQEQVAVTTAAQAAATEQQSLAPLFADLNASTSVDRLPVKLQQAIAQVLAQQTGLDPSLEGGDIQTAFQKSGLFLEASLANGSVPQTAGPPDLKAALLVLRQTLQALLPANEGDAVVPRTIAGIATTTSPQTLSAPGVTSPPLPAGVDVQEILLPQARLPVADDLAPATGRDPLAPGTTPFLAKPNPVEQALQEFDPLLRTLLATPPKDVHDADVTVHTNIPPPPLRGALPSAQPVAAPSIVPDAPLATTAHHLLDATDAAIARQTLLQVASLPDRVDTVSPQNDLGGSKWNFEIPFVTAQGTAMAQFEIARDGGGAEVEAAKRVWRARFSLDVEPAGPVHAMVSLIGDRTSVRMWAERPATAVQLRDGAAQLSQALSDAALTPGDIVIQHGTPPQPAPARAGHFLDRAL